MFQDPVQKVREAVAWVFSRICEHHSDVIANEQSIHILIPVFIQFLADKPKVSNQICHAIENLAHSLAPQQEDQVQNALSPFFDSLFKSLFQNAYRTDSDANTDLALASFTAVSAISEYSCKISEQSLFNNLIPLLQQIELTLEPGQNNKRNKEMQDYLAGILQIILVRIGSNVSNEIAENIVLMLTKIF